MANTPERRCKGTSAKTGLPCKAFPLKDGDYCLSHDVDARETVRFGGAQPGAGRPKLPRPTELAERLLRENATVLYAPHFRALGYELTTAADSGEGWTLTPIDGGGAKLFGTKQSTGEVRVSNHDDLGAMIAAAEKLQDRVYGRPKQSTEITGAGGGPLAVTAVDLRNLSDEDVTALRGLLAKASGE